MIDASTGFNQVVLAAYIDRPVTVHIGDWTIVVRPEDSWHDEGTWEETIPYVEYGRLKSGALKSVLHHAPSDNLALVSEEVAHVGRHLGYHNLIPVPPVDQPSITLQVGLTESVLIRDEGGDGEVFVRTKDCPGCRIIGVIYGVNDLPEYVPGIVHLVSKEVAQAAVEMGRYDVVANPF